MNRLAVGIGVAASILTVIVVALVILSRDNSDSPYIVGGIAVPAVCLVVFSIVLVNMYTKSQKISQQFTQTVV